MAFTWNTDLPASDEDPVNKEEWNEVIENSDWLDNNLKCQSDYSDRSDNTDYSDQVVNSGDYGDNSNEGRRSEHTGCSEDSIDSDDYDNFREAEDIRDAF